MSYTNIEQKRRYQREWCKNRRDTWISVNGPCHKCGSNENLEIDHIDPSTKITSRFWSMRGSKRTKELQKCQVLCHSCHLNKTIRENSTALHGSNSKYRAGCRCDACREDHIRVNNEWRWKKGLRVKGRKAGRPPISIKI